MLSLDTLNLLAVLLSQVTLSPTSDEFAAQAVALAKARRELLAAIAAAQPNPTYSAGNATPLSPSKESVMARVKVPQSE